MQQDAIEVLHNQHGHHVTVWDYHGHRNPLEFTLTEDQAADLHRALTESLKPRAYTVASPAQARWAPA